MIKKIIRFPFFAFLLGIFPIIALWNANKSQIYPQDVLLAIGLSVLFVLAIWFLCLLIFRTADRASLVSSLVFIIFFSYGHVYNLIKDKLVFGTTIGFIKLSIIYAVVFIVLLIIIIKIKRLSADVNMILNFVFMSLVVINIVQIIHYESLNTRAIPAEENTPPLTVPASADQNTSTEPDIYYIILDSYSRQDVLKELLNYDNSEFIHNLEQRGFFVADCSNANYSGTVASLTSTLNYSYLDINNSQSDEQDKALSLSMKNNKIRKDLAEYGYLFVTSKGFNSEDDINNPDIYLNYLRDAGIKDTIAQSQFTKMYFETTLLRTLFEYYYMDPVKNDILPQWFFISHSDDTVLSYASFWYNQTKYEFDYMEGVPEKNGNYFVYAHINPPHAPFVFDTNGKFHYTYEPEDTAPYYLDQISYLDKRVIQLVDVLLAKSTTPPIIIIQGDHGAHVLTTGVEKHKILNAYFVPEKMRNDLYETITPVNTFRLILRDVFGQNIDLLPDTLYAKITNDLEPLPSQCTYP